MSTTYLPCVHPSSFCRAVEALISARQSVTKTKAPSAQCRTGNLLRSLKKISPHESRYRHNSEKQKTLQTWCPVFYSGTSGGDVSPNFGKPPIDGLLKADIIARKIQMLCFHNTSEEMQKIATYVTKSIQLLRDSPQDLLTRSCAPRPGWGRGPGSDSQHIPNACYYPNLVTDWIKRWMLSNEQ